MKQRIAVAAILIISLRKENTQVVIAPSVTYNLVLTFLQNPISGNICVYTCHILGLEDKGAIFSENVKRRHKKCKNKQKYSKNSMHERPATYPASAFEKLLYCLQFLYFHVFCKKEKFPPTYNFLWNLKSKILSF